MAESTLTYVRQVYLSGANESQYMTLDFSGMSAYTDAVVFFQGWKGGNDNDGNKLRVQFYHSTGGWNQSYNTSTSFSAQHASAGAAYHYNNNPGMEICEKFLSYKNIWGYGNNGGMACYVFEFHNIHAAGGKTPCLSYRGGTPPPGRNDSTFVYHCEWTEGNATSGTSFAGRNSAITQARLYSDQNYFRGPSQAQIYGRS